MNKTFYIYTLGCQQNKSDSERIASVFKHLGYEPADNEKETGFLIINSCAVRQSSMDRIYGKLRHWRPRRQAGTLKTMLTGCVLNADKEKLSEDFDYVVDLKDIPQIPGIIGEGNPLDLKDYFAVEPKHDSEFKAFVPIMTGCDKFCAYCAVPYTRGREMSRPVNEILNEVKELIRKGYKEIFLLGQNVNSYAGLPDKTFEKRHLRSQNEKFEYTGFPELLEMIAQIPGDFWIRYTTSHPYDMSDDLIKVMSKYPKVVNYINLPVQSGDDEILKKMNRHYSVDHYLERLKKIREMLSPVCISTDIIVGFPGETEQQFDNTAKLLREVEYDMAYINQYSPRPGTVSAQKYKDDVCVKEKHRRDVFLNDILERTSLKNNQKFIGQTVRVLVDEVKENNNGLIRNIGRTDLFKPIQFIAARSYLGKFVDVKVVGATAWNLQGELT